MATGPEASPVTRRSLAHATIDFLENTKLLTDQMTLYAAFITSLQIKKRPFDTHIKEIRKQAIETANDMLAALGGVAIRLAPEAGSDRQQIMRLTEIKDFVSPEGPPAWLISASPAQCGIVAMDFQDARERLHE